MQLDSFVFKLLLLSIPGFISYTIFKKIAVYRREQKKQSGFIDVFFVVFCSLISCIIYDLSIILINKFFHTNFLPTFEKIVKVEMLYTAGELVVLCAIAVVLGFAYSFFETHKIINTLAMKLRITEYYGDTDVWTSFCASKDVKWIYIRDHKLHLIYYGFLEQYSDPGESRELLITEVKVFTEDGDFCYDCPSLYICRQFDEITLELPYFEEGETDDKANA